MHRVDIRGGFAGRTVLETVRARRSPLQSGGTEFAYVDGLKCLGAVLDDEPARPRERCV